MLISLPGPNFTAWSKVVKSILSHSPVISVIDQLHEGVNWPSEESQQILNNIMVYCDTFPLSAIYYRKLMKACSEDIETLGGDIEDCLMERVVEACSCPPPAADAHDVCHFSYVVPFPLHVPVAAWPQPAEEQVQVAAIPLRVLRDHNLVGMKTWEAGLCLTEMCLASPPELFTGKCIVELGAGIGSTACILSQGLARAVPQSIILTDFNELVLENADHNIKINESSHEHVAGRIHTTVCDWRDVNTVEDVPVSMRHADLILAADCTYSEDIIDHLLRTMTCLVAASKARVSSVSPSVFQNGKILESDTKSADREDTELKKGDEDGSLLVELGRQFGPIIILTCTERSIETWQYLNRALKSSTFQLRCRDITQWARKLCKGGILQFENRERVHTFCLYSAN